MLSPLPWMIWSLKKKLLPFFQKALYLVSKSQIMFLCIKTSFSDRWSSPVNNVLQTIALNNFLVLSLLRIKKKPKQTTSPHWFKAFIGKPVPCDTIKSSPLCVLRYSGISFLSQIASRSEWMMSYPSSRRELITMTRIFQSSPNPLLLLY